MRTTLAPEEVDFHRMEHAGSDFFLCLQRSLLLFCLKRLDRFLHPGNLFRLGSFFRRCRFFDTLLGIFIVLETDPLILRK